MLLTTCNYQLQDPPLFTIISFVSLLLLVGTLTLFRFCVGVWTRNRVIDGLEFGSGESIDVIVNHVVSLDILHHHSRSRDRVYFSLSTLFTHTLRRALLKY